MHAAKVTVQKNKIYTWQTRNILHDIRSSDHRMDVTISEQHHNSLIYKRSYTQSVEKYLSEPRYNQSGSTILTQH